MARLFVLLTVGALIAGCSYNDQRNQGYGSSGYGSSGGPGGMGSPQGPMPYGDIPGAVGGSGR